MQDTTEASRYCAHTGVRASARLIFLAFLVLVSTFKQATEAVEVPFSSFQGLDGRRATGVAAIDLDRDGDLDLVAATSISTDQVFWLENTSGDASTWTARTLDSSLDGPRAISAADLDGDGDYDLAVAADVDDTIAWYENDGLTFTRHDLTTTANGAQSVKIGDLDADGDLDLVYCAPDGDELAWLENDGAYNPTFTKRIILWRYPPPTPLIADNPIDVELVDLNGDSDLDILWASALDDRVGWLLNNGADDPVFSFQLISDTHADLPRDVGCADVDGDGDPDVLTASADGEIWFFRNTGSGFSWQPIALAAAVGDVFEISPRDLDGDGDLDVVAYSPGASTLVWFENAAGNGTAWIRRNLSQAAGGALVAITADLDRDGDFDIVSAGASPGNSLAWYENTTIHRSVRFGAEHIISIVPNGPNAIEAGDIDGDGDIDLAVSSFWDKTVRWYENAPGGLAIPGAFDEHTAHQSTLSRYPEAVTLADMNEDGDLDVVVAFDDWVSHWEDLVSWFENDGSTIPGFTVRVVSWITDGPVSVAIADINDDGNLDVVSSSLFNDTVYWYESSGGLSPTFVTHTILDYGNDPMSVWPADLANNGTIDVAVGYRGDDTMTWFWNDGADPTPDFSSIEISYATDGPRGVTAADIDRDGLLDLVCAAENGDAVSWLRNDGVSMWVEHMIDATADGASWVRTVDLDRDGDIDVLGALTENDSAVWYENFGGAIPTWRATVMPALMEGPRAMVPGDFDRDGDLDVAVAWYDSDTVAWYENRGGQYTFAHSGTAPAQLQEGAEDDLLRITLVHNGRNGDTAIEWAALALRFESDYGVPFTGPELDSIIDYVRIYEDTNGSGIFEPASDVWKLSAASPALTDGVWTAALVDGASHWSVGAEAEKSFFVVVKLADNAAAQGIQKLRVIHLNDPSGGTPTSRVEDRLHDIELEITRWTGWIGNFRSGFASIVPGGLFSDGFESGDVSRWSSSTGLIP
jgi:hypothetical protein